jgi:hypothetical protein
MDWFERLTGFPEREYEATKQRLDVVDGRLHSTATGRTFATGRLEVVSLQGLRDRTRTLPIGRRATQVGELRGDVRYLHQLPENVGALFQVASQFNLLEMIGPSVTPEDGVTRYESDRTQGPACAIAAGAATIYRNYFVPVEGQSGQTATRQINCLQELGAEFGHGDLPLWAYRNGYALCTAEGLMRISRRLCDAEDTERDRLRGKINVGVHWDVEVTDAPTSPGPLVSQIFCSALPVAYSDLSAQAWEPFARLVLEAAYEATMLAAVINSVRPGGSRRVLLTRLGGGVFGNDARWIDEAMKRATDIVAGSGLEVLHVVR